MKILIPSVHVPFIKGGAELMTNGLLNALRKRGHQVEVVRFPFKFNSSYLIDLMKYCDNQNFSEFNGHQIDKIIALQFPAYYVKHENKALWLMHQHRAVYDLFEEKNKCEQLNSLRKIITEMDNQQLAEIVSRFSISENVSFRLKKYNHLESTSLYHPPFHEEKFYSENTCGYIFFPSRLETLKRQTLLIEAMRYVRSPVKVIIAGEGSQSEYYKSLINQYNLQHTIKIIGNISENEKYMLYARSLGIFFAPYDEDYGYITLEAMLSSKPVITCVDSGAVLEFVSNNNSGFIVDPNPTDIAEKIDYLFYNKRFAKEMGHNGKLLYLSKNISWDNVVDKLIEDSK